MFVDSIFYIFMEFIADFLSLFFYFLFCLIFFVNLRPVKYKIYGK
jgi:hypothetical protein